MKRFLLLFAAFCFISSVSYEQISVTGTTGSGRYATLQAAFAAINAGTISGVITITVTGNTTETGTAVLNASGSGSASYSSVFMQPSGGAWTISGAITAGSPLVNLNGADNVTIDGLNTGGKSLTFSNTTYSTTTGTSTIRFIADATNNTILLRCRTLQHGRNAGEEI